MHLIQTNSAQNILKLLLLLWLAVIPATCHAFSAVTYNLAGFSDSSPERITKLLASIIPLQSDVVFLQENTRTTLIQIHALPIFNEQYDQFYKLDRSGQPLGGLVTLIKKSWQGQHIKYRPLPSDMERGMLSVQISVCKTAHQLINIHLESQDLFFWISRARREAQLDQLNQWLMHDESVILVGDFNVAGDDTSIQRLPSTWHDVWLTLYPSDPGLTWDPHYNDLAWRYGGFIQPGQRFDRIMIKSNKLQPNTVQRIGLGQKPALSDHYGVLAEFKTVC